MTATAIEPSQRARSDFTLAPGTHVCLVTGWPKLVERFTQALRRDRVRVKHQLADLIGELGCRFVVVDTKVHDFNIWPAPLLLESSAAALPWLFLVEDLGVSSFLQRTPQDCVFFERRIEAVDAVFDYISKRFQDNADRIIERVNYVKTARVFIVRMQNAQVYALRLDDIPEADRSEVLRCTLSRNRNYFRVVQASGNQLEIPWDDVLYHCEPKYEYYQGKPEQSHDADRAARIGQRVRALRMQQGLSTTELAHRAGMQRPNVSRLESGRHVPALDTLERIADALGVPVAALIAVNGARPNHPSTELRQ